MESPSVSVLLEKVRAGDSSAVGVLLPMVYGELHSLAEHLFRSERSGHTLQPTALVNEAWMRMAVGIDRVQDRTHFFRVAALAMRHVLTDHARKHNAIKKGGGGRD
jgi:RNA polymerase sigma factor (TIGR02999 family)